MKFSRVGTQGEGVGPLYHRCGGPPQGRGGDLKTKKSKKVIKEGAKNEIMQKNQKKKKV